MESSVSYPGRSPLCPGKSRAIPPLTGLNVEKSALIVEEKAAKGIVGQSGPKARTVSREGIKREERSFVEEER